MPKQLIEINKFMNGTITTPDATDTPEQSATYSLNLDCVNKDGALQGAPINSTTIASGTNFDKCKIIKTLTSSNTIKEDVLAWNNTDKKLQLLENAQNASPALNTQSFNATYSGTDLIDVAMEKNNKEVHVGLGKVNKPKWAGYTNHAGIVYESGKLVVEDAEVKYPSSVPYMHKTVRAGNDGYVYGITLGGTKIWKINGYTGASHSTSLEGTFSNLQSIATDGSGNLYVLDKTGSGKIYKVATSDLSTKTVTYTLPATYPGPSGSQYSDIEYTSTNTTVWVAAHYDNRFNTSASSNAQLLWKFTAGGSSSTVTLTNMMPRMGGGSLTTVGAWVENIDDEGGGVLGQVEDSEFAVTTNSIQETFSRSLLKHSGDNDAIYWLARYQNTGDDGTNFGPRWIYKSITGNVSGSSNYDRVASVTVALTLALHRIKNDHSTDTNNAGNTTFTPIYNVYHPAGANGSISTPGNGVPTFSPVNINSIGINNDNTEIYLTIGSSLQRLAGDIVTSWTSAETSGNYNKYNLVSLNATSPTAETNYNMTPSGQTPRTGVNINFGYVPSTNAASSSYSADGTNMVVLRNSGTAGFDKISKTFSANTAMTFFVDHSVIGAVIGDESGTTSELQSGYSYFYKISMLYDGYQETPLCGETFVTLNSNTQNNSLAFTINDKRQISDRVSAIKVYRAENTASNATSPVSVYRLVRNISLGSGWAESGSYGMTQTISDNGFKGASFEAESELPESLTATLPHYAVSTQLNNQHYIGKCHHEGYVDDASSYIFVSKVGKFDVFDWVTDFIKLPTIPTALVSFAGRVFAFDQSNTYRIRGGNDLYIEDIFEGVGCLNDDAIVSTDFGLFFADDNNIYQHNGQSAEPIGEAIVRGSTYAWQNRDKTYHTRAMYDAERRSVYFTFKVSGSNQYYAWAWNIPRKRWDMLSFGNNDTIGTNSSEQGDHEPKGFYILNDSSLNVAYKNIGGDSAGSNQQAAGSTHITKYLGGTTKRIWTWVSKDLTMGNDTQQKNIKTLLSPTRIKINYSTNSSQPSAGSQVANTVTRGTYRKIVNTTATNLKVRLDANAAGDECGALGILYKTKRKPR